MKPYLSAAAKWVFLPIVLYFSLFVILTYPLILSFSSQLFGTPVDGFSELWNLWWINKAVTQLHCSIFWSSYTYFPKGANLLGHSMSAFNGILGIPLQRLFTLLQTHNFLLVFSFVSAGWTMFLLAHYLTRCYASALLGGFCFTFSSYHFAHAWGHMNLVSLEWLPCFILAWLLLLDRPGWWTAVFAALSLFLNLMCDPLYFVYAAISALVLLLGRMWVMRDALLPIRKPHIAPFVIFAALASYSSGLFVIPLRIANTKDPFLGGHPPAVYSMDLLGPFLPCAAWRFNHWTEFFWSRLPEAGPEFNAYVGGVAFILAILGLWAEWKTPNLRTRSWGALAIVFTLLALGPVPRAFGQPLGSFPGPYNLLEWAFPDMKVSGMPIRMSVMVTLFVSLLASFGVRRLVCGSTKMRLALLGIFPLAILDALPSTIPTTSIVFPDYVDFLRDQPGNDPVIDTFAIRYDSLLYQTRHGKPIALGHVAKRQKSGGVSDGDMHFRINEFLNTGDSRRLFEIAPFRFMVVSADTVIPKTNMQAITAFSDRWARVLDLDKLPREAKQP